MRIWKGFTPKQYDNRHSNIMSHHAEEVLCNNLKNNSSFTGLMNSEISKCHIVAFIRFENDGEIREFFLYCKEQTGMSKGQEVFNVFPVIHKQNVCLGRTVLTSVLMVTLSMLDSMRDFISL